MLFADDATGAFVATLVLHSFGSNASGFVGALDDTTLVLRGDVIGVAAVPEPETYALMLTGLGVVGFLSRSRRSRAMGVARPRS